MKKLEELGISPAPWKCIRYKWNSNGKCIHFGEVRFADGVKLVSDIRQPDAQMASAAPELYEALWFQCFGETGVGNCRNCKGAELGNCKTCPLGKARVALAKASGEAIE